ncbi:MAG: hypothetical protein ACF8PN_09230 [Phycisphaerales bacterium]
MTSSFHRLPRRRTDKPRRVRGGIKLNASQAPVGAKPVATAWESFIVERADEAARTEGFDYARKGQISTIETQSGGVVAKVMGRDPKAYRTRLECRVFGEAEWERLVETLSGEARLLAEIVSGEITDETLAACAAMGLPLTPTEDETRAVCTCAEAKAGAPVCKHAVTVAHVLAERLNLNAGLAFAMRGMPYEELTERLRLRRSVEAGGGSTDTIQEVDLASRVAPARALEDETERFWNAGAGLEEIRTRLAPPDVAHPLLRRIGPSPFTDCRFPLVGLLATCYDIMSESVIREQVAGREVGGDEVEEDHEPIDDSAEIADAGHDAA